METKTKEKLKKIGGIALNVVLWAFVIFSVVITVVAVSANANKKNVPTLGGNCYLSVLSDSMNAEKPEWVNADKPSGFKKGDLIIGHYIAEDDEAKAQLEVGDIITFEYDINGNGQFESGEYDTHRIKEITADGYYITQGDNSEYNHGGTETVSPVRVIAVYTGKKLHVVGSILSELSSFRGFGLFIVLPLALFFGYELFVFIKTMLSLKNEGKKTITAADEELIKQRAIEEYLRQMNAQNGQNAPNEASQDTAETETADDEKSDTPNE